MQELDDPISLAQNDSRRLLAQVDEWRQRLAAQWPALNIADIDAVWLDSCRSDVPQASNPAKQFAWKLFERIPLIWSDAPLAPQARHWQSCINRYAEAVAVTATVDEMAHNWSMARFPRFWNNAVTCVYLSDGSEPASVRLLAERVQLLLQTRRISTLNVDIPAGRGQGASLHATALGEWVALYLAVINGVDPSTRVAWDFLGL